MKKFRLFSMLLAMIIATSSNTLTAYAALDNDVIVYLKAHAEGSKKSDDNWDSSVSKFFTDDSKKASDDAYDSVKLDGITYYYKIADETKIYRAVRDIRDRESATDKIEDINKGLQVGADTGQASDLLSGFTPLINLLLGVLVFGISMAMTIFTGLDMCYIAFPVFRGKCDEKGGGTHPKWITDDAAQSLQQTSTDGSGKNPLTVYFGKRVISFIMIAIMLFILLTGNISLITNIVLNLVSGILDVLQGLAS